MKFWVSLSLLFMFEILLILAGIKWKKTWKVVDFVRKHLFIFLIGFLGGGILGGFGKGWEFWIGAYILGWFVVVISFFLTFAYRHLFGFGFRCRKCYSDGIDIFFRENTARE